MLIDKGKIKPAEYKQDDVTTVLHTIAAKAKTKGWSNNDISTLIKDNFGVQSSKELSLEQMQKLLKMIDEM